MKEGRIPPAALRDADSVEMLRVWIAEHQLHCALRIGMYRDRGIDEEAAWGTILADAARHIASALSKGHNTNEADTLDRIKLKFAAELGAPSSGIAGDYVECGA